MLNCWSQTAQERRSFPELHAIFDKFLTQQTQDSYPYMEVLSKAHHIDTTAATVAHDLDPTPINLDIEITDVDAGTRQAGWANTNGEGEVVDMNYMDSTTSFTQSHS